MDTFGSASQAVIEFTECSGTITVPNTGGNDFYVGDPAGDSGYQPDWTAPNYQSGGTGLTNQPIITQPQIVTVPGATVPPKNYNVNVPPMFDINVQEPKIKEEHLRKKTPKQLLETIQRIREFDELLDKVLAFLIEEPVFLLVFQKMREAKKRTMELLQLATNIFTEKAEAALESEEAA